jgi:hypothetical protein
MKTDCIRDREFAKLVADELNRLHESGELERKRQAQIQAYDALEDSFLGSF